MTTRLLARAAVNAALAALAVLIVATAFYIHLLPWRLWSGVAPFADFVSKATLFIAPAAAIVCSAVAVIGTLRHASTSDRS